MWMWFLEGRDLAATHVRLALRFHGRVADHLHPLQSVAVARTKSTLVVVPADRGSGLGMKDWQFFLHCKQERVPHGGG